MISMLRTSYMIESWYRKEQNVPFFAGRPSAMKPCPEKHSRDAVLRP
jgi:hypothetical protein